MCRRGKFILFTFCRACAQSRASHDEACLQQNKASTMTTIYFIPCHHGVSPQKKKKKTKKKKRKKKKLGKQRGGTWPGRGILLVLNAQSNLCSKKVFTQPEKVVSVITQACERKTVDLFELTATEILIYVFTYVSLYLYFYCKRILLKKTMNHTQAWKSEPNIKIYFAKKILKRCFFVYITRNTQSKCPMTIQFCIGD